jgi:predicted RNA polymerase sigma factor
VTATDTHRSIDASFPIESARRTAKLRAIDELRRSKPIARKHEELGLSIEAQREAASPDLDAALADEVGADLLRLVLTACHPVLSTGARAALTLRLLGGPTTEEIARALLAPSAPPRARPARRRLQGAAQIARSEPASARRPRTSRRRCRTTAAPPRSRRRASQPRGVEHCCTQFWM